MGGVSGWNWEPACESPTRFRSSRFAPREQVIHPHIRQTIRGKVDSLLSVSRKAPLRLVRILPIAGAFLRRIATDELA